MMGEATEAKYDVSVEGGPCREVIFIVVKAARMLGRALNRTRFRVPFH
jgi:hypothetical protein